MTTSLPWIDGSAVAAALSLTDAIGVIENALLGGLDPARDPARTAVETGHGELLLMPSEGVGRVGVKLVSVAPDNPDHGLPRIQAVYVLLDAATLTPLALIDGTALTSLRTPALSAVAAKRLAGPHASTLLVFGTGPQAEFHVAAMQAIRPIEAVIVVGRSPDRATGLAQRLERSGITSEVGTSADVSRADIIVCATSARTPLFNGAEVADDCCVIAVGSHTPDAAELDAGLLGRSTVVVEDIVTALREGGDVIQAVDAGSLRIADLVTLSDLVNDCGNLVNQQAEANRAPKVFKSVGMAWEDLVIAAEVHRRG